MELTAILLRTVLMYLFVFLILRLMGKREIGKLSVFDLVISIMIAEIAVIAIEDPHKSLFNTAAPIFLLVLIQIGMALLSLKSRKVRILFDGKPSVLISNGHLNREEMRKQRYNLDDLMTQLRENQITSIEEVELAVLEPTGKLSVISKNDHGFLAHKQTDDTQFSKQSLPSGFRYELLPLPLIMDGKVQDGSLEKIGKDRFWLKKELQDRGVDEFRNVFFCSVDHRGHLYIDRKN